MPESSAPKHLHIGALVFPRMDQGDFTGPFEVLSRIPESTFHVIGKDRAPVRDTRGLILTPETTFSEAPPLDSLKLPLPERQKVERADGIQTHGWQAACSGRH